MIVHEQAHFHIRLYIIIPIIFAGVAFLSSIVAFRITEYYMKRGLGSTWPISFWAVIIAAVAFFCAILIARAILKTRGEVCEKCGTASSPGLAGS